MFLFSCTLSTMSCSFSTLRSLQHPQYSPHPSSLPSRCPPAVHLRPPIRPGAFCGLRLLPGPELEAVLPELRRTWGKAVLQDPPYSMRWMANLNTQEKVGRVVDRGCECCFRRADCVGLRFSQQ